MSELASRVNDGVTIDAESMKSIKNIDELKATVHTDIGDAMVTSIAGVVLNYDPEAMIWQDSPSTALMLPSFLKWISLILIWIFSLNFLNPAPAASKSTELKPSVQSSTNSQISKSKVEKNFREAENIKANSKAKLEQTKNSTPDDTVYKWTFLIGLLIILYQVYHHIGWYLRIKSTKYKMSSQRLSVESGIFSKAVIAYELHELQNGQVLKPWNLRLFGRDTLYVSGQWLYAIKNAEAVRDLIRNAGQIEASRVEKARFR